MKSLLLFFFLSSSALIAQQLNVHTTSAWESDTSILIKSRGTNFNAPFLANLEITAIRNKKNVVLQTEDSLLFKKGIFQNQHQLIIPKFYFESEAFPIEMELTFKAVTDKRVIAKSSLIIEKPEEEVPQFNVQDTSLTFKYAGDKSHDVTILISDSANENSSTFKLLRDTSLYATQLIYERPFLKKVISLSIANEEGKVVLEKDFFYELGSFHTNQTQNRLKELLDEKKEEKPIALSGSFYVENNAFSSTPEHTNGLQYPNTLFRAQNTVSIYGIPFQLNASHTTNNNIDPNFRNFFSFSLDVSNYRNQIKTQLQEEVLSKEYPIGKINKDLDFNKAAIERLEQMKSTLLQYPDQQFEVDELLEKETKRLLDSERLDSLALSKELPNINQPKVETLDIDYPNYSVDSLANVKYDTSGYAERIRKIDRCIERYEASNKYKEALRNQQLENPQLPSKDALQFESNELFQQYKGQGIAGLLLRFQKLELGNFYEYVGKYSISDIEMKGVNAEVLVNPENSVGILRAKVNNFQSFNLDDVEGNVHLSSAVVKNTELSYFSPAFRVTQFNDKSIDAENPNLSSSYFITSLTAYGEVSSFLFYEGEVNRSDQSFDKTLTSNDDLIKDMAIYGKLEVTPFDFLALNVKYDRIGSNYHSDGVYFLTRNLQSYSVGSHWKLFKNKIYFKNDYTFINRNFEEDDLRNESKKLFYELGSRFKRIPNFQIIYTPITVDIANKLDTFSSELNANSNVTIARIFYIKRVKKTIFNTALIYSEIENDFLDDGKHTQRGFQHYVAVNNEELSFSFTSSYAEVFEKLRFISANASYKLNEQIVGSLYAANNFQNDRYSEIARLRFDVQLKEYLLVGAGAAMLLERGQNPNWGSTFGVKLIY